MAIPLGPKQRVPFEELLMSQVVYQKALTSQNETSWMAQGIVNRMTTTRWGSIALGHPGNPKAGSFSFPHVLPL